MKCFVWFSIYYNVLHYLTVIFAYKTFLAQLYFQQTRANPGAALQTPPSLIHSFIHQLSYPLVPAALQRRHAKTVKESSSSYKIDYVIVIQNFLNHGGHQHCIIGLKVMPILLKGCILPIGKGLRLQPAQQACCKTD